MIDAGGKSGAGAAESIAPHLAEVGAPGLVAAPAHTAPVRASAAPRLKSGATPAFDQPMHRDPERRQPVVNVTIGRIDIREGPDSRPPLATKKPRAPALGLGAYLDRRFRRAPR